ncbi:MAG: nucleotidyltransferase domain-containing protein [Candidatus Hodarchaeota archaeon]
MKNNPSSMDLMKVAKFLTDQVIKQFSEEVAIVAVYGSFASGEQTQNSDLDMYAIIDKPHPTILPWNFIINDRAVDFWKMDWPEAGKLASGQMIDHPWSVSASLFLNNIVLYTRSEKDKKKFDQIKQKTKLKEELRFKKIINSFNKVYSHIELIRLSEKRNSLISARWAAWNLINQIVENLSLLNNKILFKNWGSNLKEVARFPILPQSFVEQAELLVCSSNYDEMISISLRMISNVRNLICNQQNVLKMTNYDFQRSFSTDYVGMKEYIGKILSACQKKDLLQASYAATELQIFIAEELERIETQGIIDGCKFNDYVEINKTYQKLDFPDLSRFISQKDLIGLKQNVMALDRKLQEYCNTKRIKLNKFGTLRELHKYFEKSKYLNPVNIKLDKDT